jgi:hypothetical protein
MPRNEEPDSGSIGDTPAPTTGEPMPEDRRVDLTPFDFLSLRLRGPRADEANSAPKPAPDDPPPRDGG